MCLVAWPLNENEARVDLVLIETSLLNGLLPCSFFQVMMMITDWGMLKDVSLLKESDPTTLHCARLLLLLSGVSFQLIPNMGMNKHRVRDRKMLSSTLEVMEVSECEEDFHISDGNLSEDGQVEVNAYGSPIAPLDRAQDIVRGGQALVATDENIVRVA